MEFGAVQLDVLAQGRHVLLDAEQYFAGVIEGDINVIQHATTAPVVGGQVQGFLGRPGTLDRHGGLGKHRAPAPQLLYQLPGIGGQVVAVVGGHAVVSQGVYQALDAVPVEFDTGRNDQALVIYRPGILQGHAVVVRVESAYCGLDPVHALGNQRGGGFYRVALLENAGANQGPAGLVVMHLGGVDDGDIEVVHPRQQAGGHTDTGGPRTDDQDIVMRRAGRALVGRSLGRQAEGAAQVVVQGGGDLQQLLGRPAVAQLPQRPQRDGTRTRAAVGMGRRGQAVQCGQEIADIRAAELT